jgi:hypothetical protein
MGFKFANIILFFFIPFGLSAQETQWRNIPMDSLKDLREIAKHILHKDSKEEEDKRRQSLIQVGVVPAVGYTLQTGFAAVVSANAVIYKKDKKPGDNSIPSTVRLNISYSQKHQVIVPLKSVLFFNNNHTILVSDWRYLKYPTYTYGLGMYTGPQDSTLLYYQYFKLQSSILFQVRPYIYIGGGYELDYFWHVQQVYKQQTKSDFEIYGSAPSSVSSGLVFNFRMDTRDNPVND